MGNLFNRSVGLLGNILKQAAGTDIEYVRGSETYQLTMTRGRLDAIGDLVEGVGVTDTESVWIIKREDLARFGLYPPTRKDKILSRDEAGIRQIYLVMPPGESRKCYEKMGNDETLLRIFTRHRGTYE